VASGIKAITEVAAGPLSHFLAARRRKPIDYQGPNPFVGLEERYPRAWACLDSITDAFAEGGRMPLRLPDAPAPDLPSGEEVVTPPASTEDGAATIFSAIDPRFDDRLVAMLSQAMQEDRVLVTSALS
jgi:hypothetical protein